MHNPTLIPILMKDSSIPKGMLYKELKKALPCRIGIEFELAGNFIGHFVAEHPDYFGKPTGAISNYYGVYEFRADSDTETLDAIRELRVSLKDFHQLAGLYKFMQDLPKYCRLHQNGGIHIHLDMTEFDFKKCKQRKVVKNYITKRLTEIGKIFPKYTGTYNKKRVGDIEKGTWVNMSRLGTLEIRIAPLTFDYHTLMTWIVKLIRFRRILIHDCRLKSTLPRSGSHEDIALLLDQVQNLQAHIQDQARRLDNLQDLTVEADNEGDVPESPYAMDTPVEPTPWSGTVGNNVAYYTISANTGSVTSASNGYGLM